MQKLTKEQLEAVAKELEIPFEEVEEMYKRATANGLLGLKEVALKEDGLKGLASFFKGKMDSESEEEKEQRNKQKRQERKAAYKQLTVLGYLEIPEHARPAALAGLSSENKAAFEKQVDDMVMALGLPYRPVSTDGTGPDSLVLKEDDDWATQVNKLYIQSKLKEQSPAYQQVLEKLNQIEQIQKQMMNPGQAVYDRLTSQTLNQEYDQLQTALKEEGPKQGRVVNIYDWFTDPNLNKGQLNFVGKEEQEAIEEQHNAAFDLFTSKELNGQVKDNRPKTGNDAYDWFTSQNLNQGAR